MHVAGSRCSDNVSHASVLTFLFMRSKVTGAVIHLASSSPRRRELLTAMGIGFTYAGVDIDERPRSGESVGELVRRLAEAKASAGGTRQAADGATPLPTIGADTLVAIDDRILGKPASKEDALRMLALLSGRTHRVLTAVSLWINGVTSVATAETKVEFREITPDEALAYWQSGEPGGKAGAYAIQGKGGVFVASLAGSYTGVVGLPVFETAALLRSAGIDVLSASGTEC